MKPTSYQLLQEAINKLIDIKPKIKINEVLEILQKLYEENIDSLPTIDYNEDSLVIYALEWYRHDKRMAIIISHEKIMSAVKDNNDEKYNFNDLIVQDPVAIRRLVRSFTR